MEPHDRMATDQGGHGGGRYLRRARHAEGVRHSFGVNAFQSNVPPHLVQRWLGHASLRTTAIYGDVMGSEERSFAERMWRS
jgi:integrase/recombinase XerD